jgi:diguanylate cyclase (GGDEF)-like protein
MQQMIETFTTQDTLPDIPPEAFATHEYNPAYTDELTGLPDRRALNEILDVITTDPEYAGKFCLMFGDLDGLKNINSSQGGHDAGDKFIIGAAHKLLDASVGGADTPKLAIRLSGDEFVVLIFGDPDSYDPIEEKLKLQEDMDAAGFPISIGYKMHEINETASELLKSADTLAKLDKTDRKMDRTSPEQQAGYLEIGAIALRLGLDLRAAPDLIPAISKRLRDAQGDTPRKYRAS